MPNPKVLFNAIAGIALAVVASTSLAATTWTLTNSSANEPEVTGWKASTNTSNIYSTSVGYWSGSGIGVGGESSSDGQHSLDNQDGLEVAMLSFDQKVNLDKVTIGWSQTDSDMFVLAYTGSASTVSLLNKRYDTLLSNGWSLVGNYLNVSSMTNSTASLSSAGIYSQFWLIGAGGFTSGTGVGIGNPSTLNDYVKVASVGGTVKPNTPNSDSKVPEPGSLALAGLGLLGLIGLRRRKVEG